MGLHKVDDDTNALAQRALMFGLAVALMTNGATPLYEHSRPQPSEFAVACLILAVFGLRAVRLKLGHDRIVDHRGVGRSPQRLAGAR